MVTAQIASIPDRYEMLEQTVESLWHQADQINVMLNNYEHTPTIAGMPKVKVRYRKNEKGDAEKIYKLGEVEGYVFTCDDDLIYPPDYVESMLEHLAEFDDQAILSCHGRVMNPKPVNNSYTDRQAAYHCLHEVTDSVQLDIGGTGVMCWHSDYFFPDYNRVKSMNMLDIWIHGFALEQGCQIFLHPHAEGWILYQTPPDPEDTIWHKHFPFPAEQTKLYNSFG